MQGSLRPQIAFALIAGLTLSSCRPTVLTQSPKNRSALTLAIAHSSYRSSPSLSALSEAAKERLQTLHESVLVIAYLEQGIQAARTIFGKCFFDAEKCQDGIQALRHYRYE
jgi:hypothetical protein